jgi:hypothetical protein
MLLPISFLWWHTSSTDLALSREASRPASPWRLLLSRLPVAKSSEQCSVYIRRDPSVMLGSRPWHPSPCLPSLWSSKLTDDSSISLVCSFSLGNLLLVGFYYDLQGSLLGHLRDAIMSIPKSWNVSYLLMTPRLSSLPNLRLVDPVASRNLLWPI